MNDDEFVAEAAMLALEGMEMRDREPVSYPEIYRTFVALSRETVLWEDQNLEAPSREQLITILAYLVLP